MRAACSQPASPLLLGLPLLAGGMPYRFILLAVAMLAAVPTLYWLATDRKRWAMTAVVVVVSIELLASAVYSGMYRGGTIYTGLETGERPNLVPQVLKYPDLSETDFLRPTAFVDIIRNQPDRYLTYVPPAASFDKGTCSRNGRRTGRRSPWSAGRCSASPTCWATTRCSSPATGRTSARPTRTRSSTTRPCSGSRHCRTCG